MEGCVILGCQRVYNRLKINTRRPESANRRMPSVRQEYKEASAVFREGTIEN